MHDVMQKFMFYISKNTKNNLMFAELCVLNDGTPTRWTSVSQQMFICHHMHQTMRSEQLNHTVYETAVTKVVQWKRSNWNLGQNTITM